MTDFHDAVGWASTAFREITVGVDDTRLHALLTGSDADRRLAALLIGLRRDPTHLPTLASLVSASASTVRFSAAESLGYWAAHVVGGSAVHELIERLLDDPGTRTSRGIVAGLSDKNPDAVTAHRHALLNHRSAWVRSTRVTAPLARRIPGELTAESAFRRGTVA